ncbi:MAG: hypothetical protein R3F61_32020 [Myxococcota bacterium]
MSNRPNPLLLPFGFSRYGQMRALSQLVGGLLAFLVMSLRMCMTSDPNDLVYDVHRDRPAVHAEAAPGRAPAIPEHHMAGAYYPEDHPELASAGPESSLDPIALGAAVVGGVFAASLAGSFAFFLLGGTEPEHPIADADLDR